MTMGHTVRKYSWVLALYFACITLCDADLVPAKDIPPTFLNSSKTGELGKEVVLTCSFSPDTVDIEWLTNGAAITPNDRIKLKNETKELEQRDEDGGKKMYKISTLTITNATVTDHNNYTCRSKLGDKVLDSAVNLNLTFPGELVKVSETIRRNATDPADVTLWCHFKVFNSTEVVWKKNGDDISDLNEKSRVLKVDAKHINATYDLTVRHTDDDGTYTCTIWDPVKSDYISGEVKILVYAAPVVTIEKVIAISSSQLYLNWTVRAFNSPIIDYTLWYKNGSDFRQYNKEKINVNQTSFVMEGLQKSTEYELGLEVATTFGKSKKYMQKNKTLESDPSFVPNITINGFSATSVTIGWAPPPPEIAEYIHYYLLEARKKNESEPKRAYHSKDSRNPYMFDDLEPHSTYVFRVCACSEYTNKCGNWSKEMDAITLDGIPGKPNNVVIHCPNAENNYINLTWQPPLKPNAEIKGYSVELTSNATYIDRYGLVKQDMSGSKLKFMSNEARSFRYDDIRPNTNYTVRVSAMTRTRRRGDDEMRACRVPPAPPDVPPKPRWRKIMEGAKYLFKLSLPRVSERNGPICCYRIYMVRLPPAYNWNSLRSPQDINIVRYAEAHSVQPTLTAYITDLFTNEDFPTESELVMGDGVPKISNIIKPSCQRCLKKPKRPYHEIVTPKTTVTTTTTAITTTSKQEVEDDGTTDNPEIEDVAEIVDKSDRVIMMESIAEEEEPVENITSYIQDGPLDSNANYTLFVELIPDLPDGAALYSDFVNVLMPAPSPTAAKSSTTLEIALQATCACAALVLLAMIVFCVLQTRRSRKLPPGANLELDPIRKVFRIFVGLGGRQQLVTAVPPDLPPIAKEDLAAAYAERQADSDYGFQKEFELLQILPECFTDRTTHASEARENQPKNRYPDIKAYDQTRVKLAQIDSVTGSDYINANYVRGYKEPKKFICAQGPTETTVNDFWRMIWEHDLELIVMLTNLEEYSKVKCSKYWPDEVRGFKAFGNITVHHVSEKRYSDYIVRELKITKQLTNSEGQPIVENNGIAKRNGDCKDVESSSAPTSPREGKESNARIVRQYHFLMWKDFAAPEYPYSILRFIKRVNEAWSNLLGRPAVVHCSAGVGRTGTLVALDCLLEQLRATGHVAVFNTVAELRTQRNFLVQSLKQYVFVYRALVEYAHFGDTEIPARRLKSAIDRLRNTPEGADKCLMEHEFEKIVKCPISEGVKSCAAGGGEEVRARNRSNDCLPYDRNRVILAPVPQRDYSTYINASFIEAYDNSEGFIITQDPLPNTIMDFWRMVSEHNVSTIVMLSEIGEGKCPRYWDDGTAQYEHISVQYEESESCPYYTRRQFRVTNNKNGEVISVRQLQYQGWPTAPGHVPEVTRGLADLADAARPEAEPGSGPMLVHCQCGTERSSLFVALCVLICQLRTERRVDVCTVARKVRSQRARTIETFLQYEFLHRAILNYAELHNLLEES